MCTGLEIAAVVGGTAAATSALSAGKGGTPAVVRQDPVADQAAIDAQAAGTAAQERTARKRRIRANSLLATGGQGDTVAPITGQAAAKPTLGA